MTASFPVSVKGIVRIDGRFALLENERNEWELPGGRLEPGEQPKDCLAREIEEELNVNAEIGALVDAHVFEALAGRPVLILVYETRIADGSTLAISSEHRSLGLFSVKEIAGINLPEGYRKALVDARSI